MVSTAAFGPGDPSSNPGWFAVLNSNKNLGVMNNTRVWYSSKYCNPAMGDTLEGGDEQTLANMETKMFIMINWCIWIFEAHGTCLISPENIVLAGS